MGHLEAILEASGQKKRNAQNYSTLLGTNDTPKYSKTGVSSRRNARFQKRAKRARKKDMEAPSRLATPKLESRGGVGGGVNPSPEVWGLGEDETSKLHTPRGLVGFVD